MQLPTRKSYSLKKAVSYINQALKTEITLEDLIYYIKKHNLRTVFQMEGIVGKEKSFVTSICERPVLKGKSIFSLGIQYHNEEYERIEEQGLLEIINQKFTNDFLTLTFQTSNLDKHQFTHLPARISGFEKQEILDLTGFQFMQFSGYFEISPDYYLGNDEELAEKGYLEIGTEGFFTSAMPKPLRKATHIYFVMNSEELIKVPFSSIEILHDDLVRFINAEDKSKCLNNKEIVGKSETSYLNIVGALLETILKDGQFENQNALINYLQKEYEGYIGISESNLKRKFAEARTSLKTNL